MLRREEKKEEKEEGRRKHAKFSALPSSIPITFHDSKTPFLNGYCRSSSSLLSFPGLIHRRRWTPSSARAPAFFWRLPRRQPIFAFRIRNDCPLTFHPDVPPSLSLISGISKANVSQPLPKRSDDFAAAFLRSEFQFLHLRPRPLAVLLLPTSHKRVGSGRTDGGPVH